MSLGTLYANFRIRTWSSRAIVNSLNLDVKIVEPENDKINYSKRFPLNKVPAFYDSKGYKLTEVMAINYYLISLSNNNKIKEQLLGKTIKEKSDIIKWQSLANSDLITKLIDAFFPLRGDRPYNKKIVDDALKSCELILSLFEDRLSTHTYLVTEKITLADIFCVTILTRGFNFLFGKKWRLDHPAITRWFNTIIASDFLKAEYTDFKFIENQIKPQQQVKKQEPKKKQESKKTTEDAPTPKKPKHPLEELGKSTFILDEWKRQYSNEDTRPVALPWFWKHYNPDEYSIYKVDYKYNDELTLTFMSNNLVGGFFNRLSASTKYIFGCMVVYGENNNNGIVGAIMVRGKNHELAFNVAPDWESYSYKLLDPINNSNDKEFIENMWAWDKPYENKEIVDGKVLK